MLYHPTNISTCSRDIIYVTRETYYNSDIKSPDKNNTVVHDSWLNHQTNNTGVKISYSHALYICLFWNLFLTFQLGCILDIARSMYIIIYLLHGFRYPTSEVKSLFYTCTYTRARARTHTSTHTPSQTHTRIQKHSHTHSHIHKNI